METVYQCIRCKNRHQWDPSLVVVSELTIHDKVLNALCEECKRQFRENIGYEDTYKYYLDIINLEIQDS